MKSDESEILSAYGPPDAEETLDSVGPHHFKRLKYGTVEYTLRAGKLIHIQLFHPKYAVPKNNQ